MYNNTVKYISTYHCTVNEFQHCLRAQSPVDSGTEKFSLKTQSESIKFVSMPTSHLRVVNTIN